MKKKLFLLLSLCFSLSLASCRTNTEDVQTRRADNVSAEVKGKYGLNNLTKMITTEDASNTDRFEIYVAENTKESLVLYSKNIDSSLDKHKDFKPQLTSKNLSFAFESKDNDTYKYSSKFTTEELNKVVSELTKNVKVDEKDVPNYVNLIGDVSFDLNNPLTLSKTYNAEVALLVRNDNKSVTFDQVFLPLLVKRYKETNLVLESYLFLPLYAQFASEGKKIVADDASYKLEEINLGAKECEFKFVNDTMLLLTGTENNPEYQK